MEYKRSLSDVKKALEQGNFQAGPVQSPAVTANSPGVRIKRALDRLEKANER
jgi:hypothetical protein